MTSGICFQCGNHIEEYISSHHIIPRWCGGTNDDIIEVCRSCHKKLDYLFDMFIKYGQLKPIGWRNVNKTKEHAKIYRKENKISISNTKKEWYIKNKEYKKQKAKEYYEKNKEIIRKNQNEYYNKNKDKWLAYRKMNKNINIGN